jgi:hypothetical protein
LCIIALKGVFLSLQPVDSSFESVFHPSVSQPTMKNQRRVSSIRVCAHCNCGSKRLSKTNLSNRTVLRIPCPLPNCHSTFSRPSDLARHQKSIHGPKMKCAHIGCEYTTGRADKMTEHVRKIHWTAGEFEPDFSSEGPWNYQLQDRC